MEIFPIVRHGIVVLQVEVDGSTTAERQAFWSKDKAVWTTCVENATPFDTEVSALEYLLKNRSQMESAFLQRV